MSKGLTPILFEHVPWMDEAACQGHDTSIFFPTRGADTAPAKAICATCTVRKECLGFALHNQIRSGIWGGMSERERRVERRRLRLSLGLPYNYPLRRVDIGGKTA